jgi:hypothetical protein
VRRSQTSLQRVPSRRKPRIDGKRRSPKASGREAIARMKRRKPGEREVSRVSGNFRCPLEVRLRRFEPPLNKAAERAIRKNGRIAGMIAQIARRYGVALGKGRRRPLLHAQKYHAVDSRTVVRIDRPSALVPYHRLTRIVSIHVVVASHDQALRNVVAKK